MRLKDRHAIITGGGSGIGAAIASALSEEGARVTLIGRRAETLEAVAETLPHALPLPADVTDRRAIEVSFAAARATHGPIDILVNSAGIAPTAPFAKLSPETWRATMATNLDALFHCCQAALPDLLAAPAGRIVTVASTAGLKGYGYTAAYGASKHGAIGLMRALAAEFAATPLTANALCPGFTDTDIVAGAIKAIVSHTSRDRDAALAELTRHNPQKRLIKPEEVAAAAVWLCLPASGSVTGQAIAIAGGEV